MPRQNPEEAHVRGQREEGLQQGDRGAAGHLEGEGSRSQRPRSHAGGGLGEADQA